MQPNITCTNFPVETSICSPHTTATILRNVLEAIQENFRSDINDTLSDSLVHSADSQALEAVDENILSLFGISIPLRTFPVHDLISAAPSMVVKESSKVQPPRYLNSLKKLKDALTFETVVPSSTASLDTVEGGCGVRVAEKNAAHSVPVSAQVSITQYHTLLAMYGDSPEVEAVLRDFGLVEDPTVQAGEEVRHHSAINHIDALQRGLIPRDIRASPLGKCLAATIHPTAAYMLQLQSICRTGLGTWRAWYEKHGASTDDGCIDGSDSSHMVSYRSARLAEEATHRVSFALHMKVRAAEMVEASDLDGAIRVLTKSLLEKVRTLHSRLVSLR